MLGLLSYREQGLITPDRVEKAECTRRSLATELSRLQDVKGVHTGSVNTLDLDIIEGRYLLSGSSDGCMAVHDLHNLQKNPKCTYETVFQINRQHEGSHKYSVETVQWYPLDTGMFLSSGVEKLLKVWDTNTLVVADEFKFNSIVYHHNISTVASQHSLIAVASQSAKVRLVDLKSGSATHTLKGHRKAVFVAKWSPRDEFLIASGSADNMVYLWDVRSSKGSMMVLDQHNGDTKAGPNSVNTAHNGNINGLCFTPDGLHVLTYGTDNRLRYWSTLSGKNTMINFGKVENECKKNVQITTSYGTSPEIAYIPADNNIEMFDLSSGEKLNTLRGHYNQVNCVLFDTQNQNIYSGANDRNILIWTPETSIKTDDDEKFNAKTLNANKFTQRVGTADAWSDDEDD